MACHKTAGLMGIQDARVVICSLCYYTAIIVLRCHMHFMASDSVLYECRHGI